MKDNPKILFNFIREKLNVNEEADREILKNGEKMCKVMNDKFLSLQIRMLNLRR